MSVKRGDVYYANLGKQRGSVQGGIRPVIIIQNNVGNRFSPTVIVAAITTKDKKYGQPTHVFLDAEFYPFKKDSVVLLEQIRTLNKYELTTYLGTLTEEDMGRVDLALSTSLGLKLRL